MKEENFSVGFLLAKYFFLFFMIFVRFHNVLQVCAVFLDQLPGWRKTMEKFHQEAL